MSAATVGYSSLCKVCTSDRRVEIDQKLLAGESLRSVSQWILDNTGVSVSHVSVRRHMHDHCNVMAAVKEELEAKAKETAPHLIEAVKKVVDSVETLDEVQRLGLGLATLIHDRYVAEKKVSMSDAQLYGHAAKSAVQAAKTKHELLHGKKIDATVTTTNEVGVKQLSDEELLRLAGEGA